MLLPVVQLAIFAPVSQLATNNWLSEEKPKGGIDMIEKFSYVFFLKNGLSSFYIVPLSKINYFPIRIYGSEVTLTLALL